MLHTKDSPHISKSQFKWNKRWQPLLESDGLGYLSAQNHITPHIGITGRLFGFRSKGDEERFASRELPKPGYRRVRPTIQYVVKYKITGCAVKGVVVCDVEYNFSPQYACSRALDYHSLSTPNVLMP